jgi:hypothetical protein
VASTAALGTARASTPARRRATQSAGLYGLTGFGASESSFAKRRQDGKYQGRSVHDTSVIVRYTTTGDANFDGIVDLGYYARSDTAFRYRPKATWSR